MLALFANATAAAEKTADPGFANTVRDQAIHTGQDIGNRSGEALTGAFAQMYEQFAAWAPKGIAALVVLVVGYFLARLAARVVRTISDKIGVQRAAERGGLVESMKQLGLKQSLPEIVGGIAFWFLMMVFVVAAFNTLGWNETTSHGLNKVANYIPNVLGALVVVVVGLLAASLVRGVVMASADKFGLPHSRSWANGTYYVLVTMTFLWAFRQLQLDFPLLDQAILTVLAGMALAFGLAVGLGGRDVVSGILAGYYLRQRMQAGDIVTVGRLEGRVREVGPVATIIETDEEGLMNRHSVPNSKMLQEAVR